ncbi:MAG TPA: hypothetical protein PLI09_03830 [Candidatus Hydrogenedentes bacterium]|nr:hypothetical protein [Candidatus Hydrogenedentota bacterium]
MIKIADFQQEQREHLATILADLGPQKVNKEAFERLMREIAGVDAATFTDAAQKCRYIPLYGRMWEKCVDPIRDQGSWQIQDWKADGGFRKSLNVFTLWKIPLEIHRPIGLGPVCKLDLNILQNFAGCKTEEDVEVLKKWLRETWIAGRNTLLNFGNSQDWDLHSEESHAAECSVQDLAQSAFIFSHIGWKNNKLEEVVPKKIIERLVDLVHNGHGVYWKDPIETGDEDKGPSIIATAMTLMALADWCESAKIALDKEMYASEDVREKIVDQIELLEHATDLCRKSLAWLFLIWTKMSKWPRYEQQSIPDVKASSLAYSVLERFAQSYGLQLPNSFPYTRIWLVSKLQESLAKKATDAEVDTIENVAFAMTALGRSARRPASLWLRNSLSWLLDTEEGDQKFPNSREYRQALRFYGVIELLRRKRCATILEQWL